MYMKEASAGHKADDLLTPDCDEAAILMDDGIIVLCRRLRPASSMHALMQVDKSGSIDKPDPVLRE